MNKSSIYLTFVFSIFSLTLMAQETIIYGTVEYPSARKIRYSMQSSYVSSDEILYEVELNEKNKYAITIDLDGPTMLKMIYNRKEMWIFVWPGAYLEMDFSGHKYYKSFKYDGDASAENTYLAKYIQKFGIVDPYEAATIFPALTVPNDIYDKMNASSPSQFYKYAAERKKEEVVFDANYPNRNSLSPTFKDFMQNRFNYRWASYLLTYSHIGKQNGYEIPDTFSMFLFDLNMINESALNNYDYIGFLEEYLKYNYHDMKGDTALPTEKFSLFAEKYELVEKLLTDAPLEMMKGRLLRRIIQPKYIPFLTTYYQDYQDYTISTRYVEAIQSIYQEASRFSEIALAPNFELLNEEGDTVRLSDFKGKVVYLSFWASWCQPCLKEMDKAISNRIALQDTNIVFLYLSVDDTRDKWKSGLKKIAKYQVSNDLHIYGMGRRSDVAKLYRVISLPQYFLIDQYGKFVPSFQKASHQDFVPKIYELFELLGEKN
jgi:peroxiredoxin